MRAEHSKLSNSRFELEDCEPTSILLGLDKETSSKKEGNDRPPAVAANRHEQNSATWRRAKRARRRLGNLPLVSRTGGAIE